jgi:inner membrane protein
MTARSPGYKLLLVGLIALLLTIPLMVVYMLVGDREAQSHTAQASITAGWGGPQVVSGPVLVIPYTRQNRETEIVNGSERTRTVEVRDELYLSPLAHSASARLSPERRSYSIYASVIYQAQLAGSARFVLPPDLERFGVRREQLILDEAELRFGVSDPRGLQTDAKVAANARAVELQPGKGLASSGGAGFYGFLSWDGEPLTVRYSYGLRGSRSIALVPRGGNTEWQVTSPWPHPSFGGSFLPDAKEVSEKGFTARFGVPNLALGQALVMTADPGPPVIAEPGQDDLYMTAATAVDRVDAAGPSMAASIGLIEPVDLYSRVDRSVKYGFLFIGFTFLAFFMFDVVGGARVAAAEYLLTGAGLVLFFVLLLAFAEVIGFTWAFVVASAAIIGLLTAYSAAVLKSRRRAGFIGALLLGLYALIYVLLSLEALSLVIGAVMLFLALAGVMYATRNIEWSQVGRSEEEAAG